MQGSVVVSIRKCRYEMRRQSEQHASLLDALSPLLDSQFSSHGNEHNPLRIIHLLKVFRGQDADYNVGGQQLTQTVRHAKIPVDFDFEAQNRQSLIPRPQGGTTFNVRRSKNSSEATDSHAAGPACDFTPRKSQCRPLSSNSTEAKRLKPAAAFPAFLE